MIKKGYQLPLGQDLMVQDKVTLNEFLKEITWTAISKARAYLSDPQTINVNAWTKVALNTENYDLSEEFDPTTNNRFTAKNSGYYRVSGSAGWTIPAASVPPDVAIAIYKNNAAVAMTQVQTPTASVNVVIPCHDLIYLDPTDYIELFVFYPSGAATVNLLGGTDKTFLSISREISG